MTEESPRYTDATGILAQAELEQKIRETERIKAYFTAAATMRVIITERQEEGLLDDRQAEDVDYIIAEFLSVVRRFVAQEAERQLAEAVAALAEDEAAEA